MKIAKSLVAMLLALVMVIGLVGCGDKKEDTSSNTGSDTTTTDTTEATAGDYNIGLNLLGTGSWTIDLYNRYCQAYIKEIGGNSTVTEVAANFSSDQMVKDVQNFISSDMDGILYFNVFSTLLPNINEMLEQSQTYWVSYNMMVLPDQLDMANANPYYAGSTGENNAELAGNLGKLAGEMGYKHAAVIAGPIGDNVHDTRVNSFTDAFIAAGGEKVEQVRCADPSEAPQKADDAMAAYGSELDCFYGINMDFVMSAITAAQNQGQDGHIMFFASDCDKEALKLVADGTVITDSNVSTDILWSLMLLINALDGHAIKDNDGNAPYLDMIAPFTLSADMLENYEKYWLNTDYVVPVEDLMNLLYRNNPNVTYDDFVNMMENYNYEYVVSANS